MRLKTILSSAVRFARDNPEVALGVAGLALKVAPPAVRKAAPIVLPIVIGAIGKERQRSAGSSSS